MPLWDARRSPQRFIRQQVTKPGQYEGISMPAWPGGPCPECGDDMPPNMLRCMTCRAWLNPELTRPDPVPPAMFDLPEIPPNQVPKQAETCGHYVVCPTCQRELRVARRYVGEHVGCKFCEAKFELTTNDSALRHVGVYLECPHCHEELRAGRKYLGHEVVCRFCDGRVTLPSTESL